MNMKKSSKVLLSVFSIMLISATILFTNSCGPKKEEATGTTEKQDTVTVQSDTAAVAAPDTAVSK
jgi:hypothetical protein